MREIICPHCTKAFKVDEAGYADILKQVRDTEFEQQLHDRLELAQREKQNAVQLAETKIAADKDAVIQELKAKLDAGGVERRLAVTEALKVVEKQRDDLAGELEKTRNAAQLAETRIAADKDVVIQELKARLDAGGVERRLAVTEALKDVEKQRDDLAGELEKARNAAQLAEARIVADKDVIIQELRSKLDAGGVERQLAVTEALKELEKQRD